MSKFILIRKHGEYIDNNAIRSIVSDNFYDTLYAKIFVKKKLNINDTISYTEENGFVIGVGTFLYKHQTGTLALKAIYTDFESERDISNLKKNIYGIYSLCICRGDICYVFNDYYGIYDVFYGAIENDYFVINNLADLPLDNKEINEYPFVLQCFCGANFSSEGIIKGCHKLLGDEYLVIEKYLTLQNISCVDYKVDVPKFQSTKQALIYLEEQIVSVVDDIYKSFGEVDICMTGGLDSRLILGCFLSNQTNNVHQLLYGRSKSFHIYTCLEDEKIVNKLANLTGIPVKKLDWTSPEFFEGIDMKWQKQFYKEVGYNNTIYCGNKKFTESLVRRGGGNFIEFGYFLEAIRLREWVEVKNKPYFSLDEYIDRYFRALWNIDYSSNSSFRKWLEQLFKDKLKYLNIENYSKIPIEYVNEVEWTFRERITDSRMHVFINSYLYSFPLFSVPQIHDFILRIPNCEMARAKFQIELIKMLNSKLLKVPIFSHRRQYRINRAGEKVLKFNMKNVLTQLSFKVPILFNALLPFYQKIRYANTPDVNDDFMKDFLSVKGNRLQNLNLEHFEGDVSLLFCMRQMLIALEESKEIL